MYTDVTRRRIKSLVKESQKQKKLVITNFNAKAQDKPSLNSSRYKNEIEELRQKLSREEQNKNDLMGYLSETLVENERLDKELTNERKKSRDNIRQKNVEILQKIDEMKEESIKPLGESKSVSKLSLKLKNVEMNPPKKPVTPRVVSKNPVTPRTQKSVAMLDGKPVILNKIEK
jgi:hypothetical protein